jgi:aminopeptidase N
MPCVDHPSDKAPIEFLITLPNHYQVVGNGLQLEETDLPNNQKLYHWKTTKALPTKVMVFGAAKFAVQHTGFAHNIPVSTWVFPERKTDGFKDFSIAKNVLSFFIEKFGDYPYDKLANVQSSTRYGGMENAGTIFYFEKSVTGEQKHENLIAHEIAHQWFGNAVSESDWPHIWLSEGFATYLTDLYVLETKGEEKYKERMRAKRDNIFAFNEKRPGAVVDFKTTKLTALLNTNSYQKGAFVLHMLRNMIGDTDFWNGLRAYYLQYKHGNASTDDFKEVMAKYSSRDLDVFFDQWLYKQGKPILKTHWIYHDNKVRLTLDQVQDQLFEFPLDLALILKDGTREIKTVNVLHKSSPFVIETSGDVEEIELDPNCNLLFEMETK